MDEPRCVHPGCKNRPTHHAWGWVEDFHGITGWSLLRWCDAHFRAVERGLRHGERTGHVVIDGRIPPAPPA